MEAYLELFKTDKLYERKYLRGGQTDGRVEAVDIDSDPEPMECHAGPSDAGLQYASEYQLAEERAMLCQGASSDDEDLLLGGPQKKRLGTLENITLGTAGPCEDLVDTEHLTAVYNNYEFDCIPQNLPIAAYKSKIIATVDAYSTVILEGHTGCGKTTQVPQYILDEARKNGTYCNIVVTQPRRIAAISIAKRVADERKWKLGSLVGYKIGLKDCISEDTRLLYCTTGVLLQILIGERSLRRYTHIILDEVHERNKDMDFLLLIVRKMQRTISRNVKVILMSATLNSVRFAQYFCSNFQDKIINAPVVAIESKKKHDLSIYYLEDLRALEIEIKKETEGPVVTPNHHKLVLKLLLKFDRMDEKKEVRGTVLVFLPGILEIDDLLKTLMPEAKNKNWEVLRLHSSITQVEQSQVFVEPAPGVRKIIAATNIAESSITVPDIKYVIDYCMMKELVADNYTNFTSLRLTWASKANCTQRAGRTGRMGAGRVYRLLYQSEFEKLLEEQIPEMKRSPLEHLVLKSKQLSSDKPKALLALALDPPELRNIESTILSLKEAGGLLMTANGKSCTDDGDITYLGRIMAELPLDIHVSKMIALGHIFGVLEDCIIMGASMSVKNMFAKPYQNDLEAYMSKLAWSGCSSSDSIAFLNAYKIWKKHHESGFFRSDRMTSESSWAKRYFLQSRCLREIKDLVEDLQKRLTRLGISDKRGPEDVVWTEDEEPLVLKLVLAGAFYPNYFIRGSLGGQVDEKLAVRELVGRDPYSTVYLQGMPQGQPCEIYTKPVKQMLKDLGPNIRVTFDDTKKAYIEFPKDEVAKSSEGQPAARAPGQVSLMVYKAIKMRQLGMDFELKILPQNKAEELYEEYRKPPLLALAELGQERNRQIYQMHDLRERWRSDARPDIACVSSASASVASSSSTHIRSKLPPLNITHLRLKSPFLEDPGRFWVNIVEDETGMKQMHNMLNTNKAELVALDIKRLYVGQMVVAPFFDTQLLMYRARIVKLPPQLTMDSSVRVYFVDYGNHEWIASKDLRGFSPRQRNLGAHTQPDFALECRLALVQPSQIKGCGQWSKGCIDMFRETVLDNIIYARIYSVVNSVMSLIVYLTPKVEEGSELTNSLNAEMVRLRHAQPAQESYLSQVNHDLREQAAQNQLTEDQMGVYEEQQCSTLGIQVTNDPQPPNPNDTRRKVQLKGPYSPLEMRIFQMVKMESSKAVAIDPNSVNSVLIDDDPQDKFDRLIVAASVHCSPDNARLTLRQTTIMPSLPGLPALVCLLFAPRVELRIDNNKERITGGLFGLGYKENDPKHPSLFPTHDIELPFDTVFTMNDILNINKLRFWMNTAWLTGEGEDRPDTSSAQVSMYQRKVKEFMQWLLARQRPEQTPTPTLKSHRWGLLSSELKLPQNTEEARRYVFPMHWGVKLLPPGTLHKKRIHDNLMELIRTCCRSEEIVEARCELCMESLQSIYQLKSHMQSCEHLTAEASLFSDELLDFSLPDYDAASFM